MDFYAENGRAIYYELQQLLLQEVDDDVNKMGMVLLLREFHQAV